MKSFSSCFGEFAIMIAVIIATVILGGIAVSTVWNWYIPPIFGLPFLSMWQAFGVSLVIRLLTGVNISSSTKNRDDLALDAVYDLVRYIFVLVVFVGTAWIVLQFAF